MTFYKSEKIFCFVLIILVVPIACAPEYSKEIDDTKGNFQPDLPDNSKEVNTFTFQADDCPCTNGKCVPENGELVCKCNSEYGLYKPGQCKACDCGKNINCTFNPRGFMDGKKCVCPTGYVLTAGKCRGSCRLNPCRRGTCEDGPGTQYKCICPTGYLGDKCEKKDLCLSNPCQNGGTCSMIGDKINCTCPVPISGKNCEKTPCSRNPCKNGGTCTVTSTGFKCACRSKYTGTICDLAPCNRNACKNGGTCQVTSTGYYCSCRDGFGGDNCTLAITPCTSNPCKNGGTCKVTGKDFQCSCKAPYSGKTCETNPCSSNPCKNGGTCNVAGTSFNCSCKAPYSGALCEKDPCSSKPCLNNGNCTILNLSFKCECPKPFSGDKCETSPCSKNPCLNNGNCTISGPIYKCSCPKPYSGEKCEIKDCHCENGFCKNETGELKCVCNPEFGLYDEHRCKECKCGKGANCTFDKGFFIDDVLCICPKGYEVKGEKCIAIDPCLSQPCQHGGTCRSHEIEYNCTCPPGYSGNNCEKDPCFSKPCMNEGTCSVDGSTFKCDCKTPFFGKKCENDTCTAKPCKNNGTCTAVSKNSFRCDCKVPFSGKTCEDDPCTKEPCKNGGKCSVFEDNFKCECKKPYFGDICSSDPCTENPCKNGGSCTVSDESFHCKCKKPFIGDNCEKEECLCENGKCIQTKDGLTCVCNPEYGPYKEGVCKACKCGPGANCTFDVGLFIDDVKCICPAGYEVHGEKCIPAPTTPSTTSSRIPSTLTETAQTTIKDTVTEAKTTVASFQPTPSTTGSTMPSTLNKTAQTTNEDTAAEPKTTVAYNPCEPNPCYNGGTCQNFNGMINCSCPYPYGGKLCREAEWCVDGWGSDLCSVDKCNFNFSTNIGSCPCDAGQLYNYNLMRCDEADMCPYMSGQCTGKNEICLNSKCQCKENYKRNNKYECVPNFCGGKYNPCGINTACEDVVGEPGHMKCSCKEGYTSIGFSCMKVNKCLIPGLLHCQQLCNTTTEACNCLPGYKLLPDGVSCELIDESATCKKDCGVGMCNKTDSGEECLCPLTHTWNGTTCVDLCTANNGSGLCPGGKCVPDEKLGFRCVCKDPFPYSNDNVTCRKKSMCTEGNAVQICAEKGATCWDDFSVPAGYRCECPIGQAIDTDGKCKNMCELKENQYQCVHKKGTCSTDGKTVKCVCPPLVTQDSEENCRKLAEFSYIVSFPLVRDKYISVQQMREEVLNAKRKATVQHDVVTKDVDDTLKFLFGRFYETSKVFNCSDSSAQNVLSCQVEVQFNRDPKDQVKVVQEKDLCTSKKGTDTCILPPRLLLRESLIKPDMIADPNPCEPEFKKIYCGAGTECSRVDNKTLNFICTCSRGFRSLGVYHPFADERTIVHRCEAENSYSTPAGTETVTETPTTVTNIRENLTSVTYTSGPPMTTEQQTKNTNSNTNASSTFFTVVTNETVNATTETLSNVTMTFSDTTPPSIVNVTDTDGYNTTNDIVTATVEITTISVYDPCEPNPCYNGGTCRIINEMIYCFCRYPYGGRFCREGEWCVDGWGATLCPHDCNFNFSSNIGRCVCQIGELYNHNLKKCEKVDMCPYMSDQCTGKNEICLNSACQCVENYKRNDKDECVPNFCESKFNPCGVNTVCEDIVDEPGHMKCSCKEGYTSIGRFCEKVSKCMIPGLLRCQQICKASTEACDCLYGYNLLPDGISCELLDQNATCAKDCGVGTCQRTENGERCVCPSTHTWNGTTCIDLCTADYHDSGICPLGKCIHDEKLGFRCLCEDPYKYSNDNVTCQAKSMCAEGNGSQICAEKGATCWDDFNYREGYRCDCPPEQLEIDGKCKNRCELKENQDHCARKQGTCATEGARIKCVCPPLLTKDTEENCNKLAEYSYIVSFPLIRDKYISTQQMSGQVSDAETKDTVDNDLVAKDVGDTLKFLFGQYYDASKVFKCSDAPAQNLLRCQVEVQLRSDPKEQKKIILDEDSCTSKNGSDTCILPPRLMLKKSLIRPDMITEANPCAPAFKKIHCGPAAECSRIDNKTLNFICTCSSGFRSNGLSYPFVDERTIVHRCEDIDECKLPKACPNRTRCSNTYGSYECQCLDGYQPAEITKDPKIVGCSAICSSKTCNHGKCEISGNQFYCKCDDGYMGKNCDQTLHASPTAEAGSMKIALIILSTMIIPLILFSIYIFMRYKTVQKSALGPNYFDDKSSLTMNMVPIDQREDDSDVPS